jgi:hypothetical protein
VSDVETPRFCWCTEPVHYRFGGNGWCYQHAPRCRSGAHFHGNCKCVGDDAFAEWYRTRCRCGHKPHRGICTARSGGTAYQCGCFHDETDKLVSQESQ